MNGDIGERMNGKISKYDRNKLLRLIPREMYIVTYLPQVVASDLALCASEAGLCPLPRASHAWRIHDHRRWSQNNGLIEESAVWW